MEPHWTVIAMLGCLILEAFFSGSEIGVVSADKIKLRHAAAKGSRGAKLALAMLEKPEWLLSTTLVGTNVAVVANTTFATALMIQVFGPSNGWMAIVLVAPLIWIFGEIVPKSIFQQEADRITPYVIYPVKAASYLFFPILVICSSVTRIMTRSLGRDNKNLFTLREEIFTMLQTPGTEGDIQSLEKNMIQRMFSFSETTAYEVMVPLIDVVAIERGSTCGEAVNIARDRAHIRLPVYEERVDKIVGVLNVLNLLDADPKRPIEPFVRPVRFIPMSKSISELLLELRKDGDVVAVVVDEFGGAIGLVTMEDIMEEIVEEMEDEYDVGEQPKQWIRRISKKEYIVSARVDLDTLEEEFRVTLPRGKYTTLAGFLLEKTGDIPSAGTVIKVKDISFIVEHRTPRAIQEVRVRL